MFFTILATLPVLLTSVAGLPAPRHTVARHTIARQTVDSANVTFQQVLKIAPASENCLSASVPEECATAAEAVPFINAAFAQYNISSIPERAALLGLMAFETGDFKFNVNHFPGRPGQGTRNMQGANFNILYALSIPAVADNATALLGCGFDGSDAAVSGLSNDTLNGVRGLVLPDEYSFASAAWFLTSQCHSSVRTAMQNDGETGWEKYTTGCVNTTVTDDRKAYFERAIAALNNVTVGQ